jgi:hypothetical protein
LSRIFRHRPITLDLYDTDDKEFNLASYLRNREIDMCLSKVKWYGLESDPIDESAAALDPLTANKAAAAAAAQYDESSLGANNKGSSSLQAAVLRSKSASSDVSAARAPVKTTALQRRRSSSSISPDENNTESQPRKQLPAAVIPPIPSAEHAEALGALNLGPKPPPGKRVLQFTAEERALMKKASNICLCCFIFVTCFIASR